VKFHTLITCLYLQKAPCGVSVTVVQSYGIFAKQLSYFCTFKNLWYCKD